MKDATNRLYANPVTCLLLAAGLVLSGCGDTGDSDTTTATETVPEVETVDITNAIFTQRSGDCADYSNSYEASVLDISNSVGFDGEVQIGSSEDSCSFVSDSIPNHDFNDSSAAFFGLVAELNLDFTVSRSPTIASSVTPLSQRITNAIFLNGVVLDLLSAGCYDPSSPNAGSDGNTDIGCNDTAEWLLDPLGVAHKFGADAHNAHVQPGGQYHYHGNPEAMFDDNPGGEGSPVIGFAADGFPVYGSYFYDLNTGQVRKAISGYTLKTGNRTEINGLNPSDNPENSAAYDGTYVADWEFTDAGDLDQCNGMTVDGQYGYYVTDTYPWVMACFSGTPNPSFEKAGGPGP